MKIITENNREQIVLKRKSDAEIDDKQILIVGKSGTGKTLALSRLLYNYYLENYNVVIINDQKNLCELAFGMFPADIMHDYQKKLLDYQSEHPIQLPIKIFHPFSFSIPKQKIPETKFFTLPIKDLTDAEFTFLLEDSDDKTTRELLLTSQSKLKTNENLWHFIKHFERLTRKQAEKKIETISKLDTERFGVENVQIGTVRNLSEVISIFNRFQTNMFLSSKDFHLNLDFQKEIFADTKTIKLFTTRYISDTKTKDFVVMALLNLLVKNIPAKHSGLLIVFDEIKDLLSSSAKSNYKEILSKEITRHLNTSFRARRISSISSSQSFSAINRNLLRSNVFNVTIIMNVDGVADIEVFKQVYGYNNETVSEIMRLDRNEFFIRGVASFDISDGFCFNALMPVFPHCEAGYNFDYMFNKYFPDKMVSYAPLIKEMKQIKLDTIKEIVGNGSNTNGGVVEVAS